MKKQILYIMCGPGFAGKSKMARAIHEHTGAILISQDAVYVEKNSELDPTLDKKTQWLEILEISRGRIKDALAGGYSVVFDYMNAVRAERDMLRDYAKDSGAVSIVVHMETPPQVLDERYKMNKDTKERHDVEEKHLINTRISFEIPSPDENLITFSFNTSMEERLTRLDDFVKDL